MASIFTYDPNPPRISSPWSLLEDDTDTSNPVADCANPGNVSIGGLQKLCSEPQEGPTEYKLHLLLRPRRAYLRASTYVRPCEPSQPGSTTCKEPPIVSPPASSNQSRQERLKSLTTQLLWRLQQSSPYHASSSKELVVPRILDESLDFDSSTRLEPLVPGLEESRGALYEIGVADDGTLVGLTNDEMRESLKTLRVMAASLGCTVEVVRMISIGDCEWIEATHLTASGSQATYPSAKHDKLWVSEALVKPHLGIQRTQSDDCNGLYKATESSATISPHSEQAVESRKSNSSTPQLRITLTGATTSGKSTLLGTLSTGTLDNGRGKSRLSLLKHRHEMVSGVTSSIAQELVGYRESMILNFSQGNVESWLDIHDRATDGRVVFLSDSGGHPRYRHTVLRGLFSWAPHWSILCVAANSEDSGPESQAAYSDTFDPASTDVDLDKTYMSLNLKLEIPLIVVITKLDLASRSSLQKSMSKVLAAIKKAGRVPKILQPDQLQHNDLQNIPPSDISKADTLAEVISTAGDHTNFVPILLTSAVKGIGIGLLHAVLSKLPLPPAPTAYDYTGHVLNPERPQCLFYIDDTFTLTNSNRALALELGSAAERGVIVSGYLRFGRLSIGDKVLIGPFASENEELRRLSVGVENRTSPGAQGPSVSQSSSAEVAQASTKMPHSASADPGEWHHVQVVSIRNLRLPVRALEPGQAGSVGVAFEPKRSIGMIRAEMPRVRRGMILALPSSSKRNTDFALQTASSFTALFEQPISLALTPGTFVKLYVASVRTSAKVLRVSQNAECLSTVPRAHEPGADLFGSTPEGNEDDDLAAGQKRWTAEAGFELLHNREWIEVGSKVIILEGSSQDRSGLEGYVGRVIEIVG